jgi:hypothetical protein
MQTRHTSGYYCETLRRTSYNINNKICLALVFTQRRKHIKSIEYSMTTFGCTTVV